MRLSRMLGLVVTKLEKAITIYQYNETTGVLLGTIQQRANQRLSGWNCYVNGLRFTHIVNAVTAEEVPFTLDNPGNPYYFSFTTPEDDIFVYYAPQ